MCSKLIIIRFSNNPRSFDFVPIKINNWFTWISPMFLNFNSWFYTCINLGIKIVRWVCRNFQLKVINRIAFIYPHAADRRNSQNYQGWQWIIFSYLRSNFDRILFKTGFELFDQNLIAQTKSSICFPFFCRMGFCTQLFKEQSKFCKRTWKTLDL